MKTRDTLTIEAAAEGGFIAMGASDYGDRARPLFAGTLKEVLAYAEKRLSPPPEEQFIPDDVSLTPSYPGQVAL